MRINKLLSNYGYCSRKEVSRLIDEERIIVNGELCTQGQWVEEYDEILLDNIKVEKKKPIYILFYKPVGVTCTAAEDIENNIINYINYPQYIFPVGRLDKESEGLILLTNDGDLANGILESENEHEKEYIVTVNRDYDQDFINRMSNGVDIGIGITRKCKVESIDKNTFNIVLTQGLNRQIRRMTMNFGYRVTKLKRVRILNLNIENLEEGQYRNLTLEELEELKRSINN